MRRFIVGLAFLLPLVSVVPSHAAPVAEVPTNATVTETVNAPAALATQGLGYLSVERSVISRTILVDGSVLLAGGLEGVGLAHCPVSAADVYNPATRGIERVGDLLYNRGPNKTTLLEDGRVLLTSTDISHCNDPDPNPDTQVYNPTTRSFEPTPAILPRSALFLGVGQVLAYSNRSIQFCRPLVRSCAVGGKLIRTRTNFAATRLANGDVLITGGTNPVTNAELYTPSTGAVSLTGTPTTSIGTQGVVLQDGRVLFADQKTAEIYDPTTRTFTSISTGGESVGGPKFRASDGNVVILNGVGGFVVYYPTTNKFIRYTAFYDAYKGIAVPNGDILYVSDNNRITDGNPASVSRYVPENTMTGSLIYPTSWVNKQTIKVAVRASSTLAPVTEVGLQTIDQSNRPVTSWTPYSTTISPTIDLLREGRDRPITLLLRDSNGATVMIGTGTVKFDMTAPSTQMTQLPAYSRRNVVLNWSGTDNLSGIEGYAVEMRVGTNGAWQRVVSNVTKTSAGVSGTHGQQLFFRVRGRDVAGNIEAYPANYDTQTTIDTIAPTGVLDVSFVGEGSVQVLVASQDQPAGTQDMRVGFSYNFDQAAWEPYQTSKTLTRLGAPAGCLKVYGQFRDRAGNIGPITQKVVPGTGCP